MANLPLLKKKKKHRIHLLVHPLLSNQKRESSKKVSHIQRVQTMVKQLKMSECT